MVTTVESRVHAAGVLAAMATTGRPVGDGEAPTKTDFPYLVLHDITGGLLDGPIADPDADVAWAYQVDAVGLTADQSRWMADKATTALGNVTVAGRTVMRNERVGGTGRTRREDGLGEPTIFTHVAVWHLHTTP